MTAALQKILDAQQACREDNTQESDDLVLLDAEPAGPVLEAEDLHPRVVREGMTMNALPNDALGLYAHHFQQGGLKNRVAPIAMAWRHHDSSVADPFPKSNEYNASDVTKLREVVISLCKPPPSLLYVAGLSNVWKHAGYAFFLKDSKGKVLSMAEFLRLPNFKGCKITVGALLPPGMARVTHLANPVDTLEDIPPKTVDMTVAEIPCRKVLDDKEKKRKKAEEKAAVNSSAADIQAEKVGIDKGAGKDGPCKKRKVRARPQVQPVSSPTPLNHAKPLETLANEEHVYLHDSAGRMGVLQTQTDEHVTPPHANVDEHATGGEAHEDANATFVDEGHGDNEGVLSGLKTQPIPIRHSGYSAGRFGNLPFTPQWGLTDSSRMDNSRECRDMMSNLFTPADHDFFNEGQANTLLRFEALKEEHADLVYAHESCNDVKARYKDYQKELAKVQAAYDGKVSDYDQVSKNYEGALVREKSMQERLEELEEEKKEKSEAEADQLRREKEHYAVEAGRGEMVRQQIINQYLPTFVRRLHQSVEYKRSLGRVFSLAIGKGFIDGISIGRKDADIQAILKATPEVDPTYFDVFIGEYEKLFNQRYPYVEVARMYLLDPSGLQNVMPDETGPTPGGGPRDTPTLRRVSVLGYFYEPLEAF
ncbi:hypothetical protein Tco_1475268 [Tanacetum coccineum]